MADFTVTNTNDTGAGSLRQAIADAAAAPGDDRIFFNAALDGQTVTLTSGALTVAGGRVQVYGDLDADGTPDITVSGGGNSSIFEVATNGRLEIVRLVLTGGNDTGTSGVGQSGGAAGGAIVNAGTVIIAGSRIQGNSATGGDGADAGAAGLAGAAGGGAAGGILNTGKLTITNTVFDTNSAAGGDGGDGGNGTPSLASGIGGNGGLTAGGILSLEDGIVSLTNVTFLNSQVQGGRGGDGGDGSATGVGQRGGNGGNGSAYSPGIIAYGSVTGSGVTSVGGSSLFGPGGAGGTGGGTGGNGYNGAAGLFGSVLLGFGTYGNDIHSGFQSIQSFFALAGNDSVAGGAGLDYIDGGGDNDTLTGNRTDQVYGSDGNDLIFNDFVDGAGIFDGQGGTDTLDLTLAAAMDATYNLAPAAGFVANGTTFRNFEQLNGTAGSETVNGSSAANRINGGAGNDTLSGLGGSDQLTGGPGVDELRGGNGDDIYIDPVLGGPDGDTIIEVLSGGIDTVRSAATFSLATVGFVENLVLTGSAAVDGAGNSRHNEIRGNDAVNVLDGNNGNDTIYGGGGNDTINGGIGNDLIVGGKNNDRMNGGAGADLFRFAASNSGSDTIAGFNVVEDRFDLSGVLFTSKIEGGNFTRLFYAGGAITVQDVTAMTLSQWNALVVAPEGGGSAGMSAAQRAPAYDPQALAANLVALHIGHFLVQPDLVFA